MENVGFLLWLSKSVIRSSEWFGLSFWNFETLPARDLRSKVFWNVKTQKSPNNDFHHHRLTDFFQVQLVCWRRILGKAPSAGESLFGRTKALCAEVHDLPCSWVKRQQNSGKTGKTPQKDGRDVNFKFGWFVWEIIVNTQCLWYWNGIFFHQETSCLVYRFVYRYKIWGVDLWMYVETSQMEATRNFRVSRLIVGEDETYSNAFSV